MQQTLSNEVKIFNDIHHEVLIDNKIQLICPPLEKNPTKLNKINGRIFKNLSQMVQDHDILLEIPKEWGVEITEGGIKFKFDDVIIGGLITASYRSDKPLPFYLPMSAEVIECDLLSDFFAPVRRFQYNLIPSAGSNDQIAQHRQYQFIVKAGQYNNVYIITFNTEYVHENTIDNIARTLQLR
ncbi:MAG: hypothetical protein ACQEXQ_27165 [Bacillota bacterium]